MTCQTTERQRKTNELALVSFVHLLSAKEKKERGGEKISREKGRRKERERRKGRRDSTFSLR